MISKRVQQFNAYKSKRRLSQGGICGSGGFITITILPSTQHRNRWQILEHSSRNFARGSSSFLILHDNQPLDGSIPLSYSSEYPALNFIKTARCQQAQHPDQRTTLPLPTHPKCPTTPIHALTQTHLYTQLNVPFPIPVLLNSSNLSLLLLSPSHPTSGHPLGKVA